LFLQAVALKHQAYRIAIGYFALFCIALLVSGLMLLILKTGINIEGVFTYYHTKSYEGLLELTHPHLGAMGVFIMVIGHFFLFTPLRHRMKWWLILFFAAALSSLVAPFLILQGFVFGAWSKMISDLLLLVLTIGLSSILLRFTRYM